MHLCVRHSRLIKCRYSRSSCLPRFHPRKPEHFPHTPVRLQHDIDSMHEEFSNEIEAMDANPEYKCDIRVPASKNLNKILDDALFGEEDKKLPADDITLYRSVVGKLMHGMVKTRVDIGLAVGLERQPVDGRLLAVAGTRPDCHNKDLRSVKNTCVDVLARARCQLVAVREPSQRRQRRKSSPH